MLRETHGPTLKQSIVGEQDEHDDDHKVSIGMEIRQALSRPLKLLVKSPVVPLCCALIFLVIGILNVFLTEMGRVYRRLYGMSSAESGSIYLGLALGFVIASIAFGWSNDRIMHALARRNKDETRPEFRLPATIVAMPIVVVGLLWYGWALHFKQAWIVPIIASGVAGLGITTVQLSVTTYLVDSFDDFSASALAAITMARSVGGAVVPLLGPILYRKLGQGIGNTVFAAANLVSCAFPVLLYIYGTRWRSMFAANDM